VADLRFEEDMPDEMPIDLWDRLVEARSLKVEGEEELKRVTAQLSEVFNNKQKKENLVIIHSLAPSLSLYIYIYEYVCSGLLSL